MYNITVQRFSLLGGSLNLRYVNHTGKKKNVNQNTTLHSRKAPFLIPLRSHPVGGFFVSTPRITPENGEPGPIQKHIDIS